VAPRGTPQEVVSKINKDTQAIFSDEGFQRKSLAPSFIYSIASDPETFADMLRRESEQWKMVIEGAQVKVE
jgi:tripartite-type tricarboxylate transporter receptor subunit TctC